MRVALISIFDNVKLSIDFINKIGEELGAIFILRKGKGVVGIAKY